jgi:hypothetical protein
MTFFRSINRGIDKNKYDWNGMNCMIKSCSVLAIFNNRSFSYNQPTEFFNLMPSGIICYTKIIYVILKTSNIVLDLATKIIVHLYIVLNNLTISICTWIL